MKYKITRDRLSLINLIDKSGFKNTHSSFIDKARY